MLCIIALGFLSLSSVTLRSSTNEQYQAVAHANARLALTIAIGELQKNAGADTRITAPADIVEPDAPPLTGVWRSWEGLNHDTGSTTMGHPWATLNGQSIYQYKKMPESPDNIHGRFLKWLVSGAVPGSPANEPLPSTLVKTTAQSNTVPLLASGTLGENSAQEVHVVPVPTDPEGGSAIPGAYAWWVSGENQKARLPVPYNPTADSAPAWSDVVKSHGVPDPEPFGLNALLVDSSPTQKTVSRRTMEFYPKLDATIKPHQLFHDISICSVGLLTNTATGGWKKDLSLLTEKWMTSPTNLPTGNLPLFRVSTTGDGSESGRPSLTSLHPQQSLFYPWSEYKSTTALGGDQRHGAVTSWQNLVGFMTSYKNITLSNNAPSIPHAWNVLGRANVVPLPLTPQEHYDFQHGRRMVPIIARIQFVYKFRTRRNGTTNVYNVDVLVEPVVTLWNPYNVTLTNTPKISIKMAKSPPCVHSLYNLNGTERPFNKLIRGTQTNGYDAGAGVVGGYNALWGDDSMYLKIPSGQSFSPGETRVFSYPSGSITTGNNSVNDTPGSPSLVPGYNPNSGFYRINIIDGGNRPIATTSVRAQAKFDNHINTEDGRKVGVWFDIHVGDITAVYMRYRMVLDPAVAATFWPPIPSNSMQHPPASSMDWKWTPYFSLVYGPRIASMYDPNNFTSASIPTKGFLQTNPLSSSAISISSGGEVGIGHVANAAYDFSFIPHTGSNDDYLPNVQAGTNRGYVLSGSRSGNGLSRAIIAGLPLRPIASLAELQNWNLRGQSQYPPHQLYIIGNSDALPLIPADGVIPKTATAGYTNMQHDDSYCANHVLFDDWFLSSITPEPTTFGSVIARNQQRVYRDFLSGTRDLVNKAYRPITEDRALGATERDALITRMITTSNNGWQTVASRLEVEGMFNVNSTSVTAWRALLGHARNQKIPHFSSTGISSGNDEVDYAVSRFPVAGDVRAGEPGISGTFEESSSFTGYQVFTDNLLDILAEKIVEQVRARGPFLSLAEFVNRKLTADAGEQELALAGAIQTALNKMSAEAGQSDPMAPLTLGDFAQDTLAPNNAKLAAAGYAFPEASIGKSTYGVPGWIRQADILSPLAPILSVRDDTFTIRAYGEARDTQGIVKARAWCDATVQRSRDYVDPSDEADLSDQPNPAASVPQSGVNGLFGRSFKIMTFRWLAPDEV